MPRSLANMTVIHQTARNGTAFPPVGPQPSMAEWIAKHHRRPFRFLGGGATINGKPAWQVAEDRRKATDARNAPGA